MARARRTNRAFWLIILLLALRTAEANNNNNQYGNNNNNKYSSQFYNGARDFTVCDNSVVRVTALYAICDSPYTFYYGNGANRNSPICDYGDKLSFEVRFQVVDDIQDDTIFVTMAVYDEQNNLLVSINPVYLCEDLVGQDCTSSGYYGFTYYRLRLPYPYDSGRNNQNNNYDDDTYSSSSSSGGQFFPRVQMAFSTKADSGYNLGALNVECQYWEDGSDNNYVEWSRNKPKRSPLESFIIDYGILLASCTMVMAVAGFIWHQASKIKVKQTSIVVEQEVDGNYKTLGLMD